MKANNEYKIDNELKQIIKQINERLKTKIKTKPEDEKYYKKYEGIGYRVVKEWSSEPELNKRMMDLMYEMNPEEKTWNEYKDKYFEYKKTKIEFGSDQFMKYFNECWQVRKFIYDKYDSVEEAQKNSKRDIIAWWGQLISDVDETLKYGEIYDFNFWLPINNSVPDYNDYIKETK